MLIRFFAHFMAAGSMYIFLGVQFNWAPFFKKINKKAMIIKKKLFYTLFLFPSFAFSQKFSAEFLGLKEEEIVRQMKFNVAYELDDRLYDPGYEKRALKYKAEIDGEKYFVFFSFSNEDDTCTNVVFYYPDLEKESFVRFFDNMPELYKISDLEWVEGPYKYSILEKNINNYFTLNVSYR